MDYGMDKKDPKGFRPTTLMPNFRLSDEESQAIAAYLWQHADERSAYEGMPAFDKEQLSQGNFIFEQVGCMACHTYEKDPVRGFTLNLATIGEKINYEYLVEWITNPKKEKNPSRACQTSS